MDFTERQGLSEKLKHGTECNPNMNIRIYDFQIGCGKLKGYCFHSTRRALIIDKTKNFLESVRKIEFTEVKGKPGFSKEKYRCSPGIVIRNHCASR